MSEEIKDLVEKFKKLPKEEQEKIIDELSNWMASPLKTVVETLKGVLDVIPKVLPIYLKQILTYLRENCPEYSSKECIYPLCYNCKLFEEVIKRWRE